LGGGKTCSGGGIDVNDGGNDVIARTLEANGSSHDVSGCRSPALGSDSRFLIYAGAGEK